MRSPDRITPGRRLAVEHVAEHPHSIDVRELEAILAKMIPGNPCPLEFGRMCELALGPAEPSDSYDTVRVREGVKEAIAQGMLFSEHGWPVGFTRGNLTGPEVHVYRVASGSIGMSPRMEVVLDGRGRPVPGICAAPFLAPLYREVEARPLRGRVLAAGTPSGNMFSQWLFDVLPRIEAARLAGFDADTIDHVLVQGSPSGFTRESLAALGFRPEQVIYGRNRLPMYRAAELIVPTQVRGGKHAPPWIRRFIRRLFLGEEPDIRRTAAPKVVYISRQNAHRRRIVNHELLDGFLERTGAVTLKPELTSISRAASEVAGAALIVGAHGAGLANAVFLPAGAAGLELAGVHVTPTYRQLICATASGYALVSGDDEHGRDVFSTAARDDAEKLDRKEARERDIVLNPHRTERALQWAEEFLYAH